MSSIPVRDGLQGAAPAVRPLTALGVTLAVQALASVALTALSVLAPVVAADLSLPARNVGWLVSLAYLTAMVSGLYGGWLSLQHGPVRVSQWAAAAFAASLALFAAGGVPWLLAGAVVVGVGYGLPNPSSAEILSRHAPAQRRGLFFSIKQTGVPLGVALAGAAFPWLTALAGWRVALLATALPTLAIALAIGASRRALEGGTRAAPIARDQPALADMLRQRLLAPIRDVLAFAPTRRLALTSLVYALVQVCFLTFLVSLLTLEHGYPLAVSAAVLSASQAVAVVCRVGWGHVSDRWVDPTRLLGLLGLTMAAGVALLGLAPAPASWAWLFGCALMCAATAVAWNGVYFADLARHVPAARMAQVTGATQVMTFCGGMVGPAIFAGAVGIAGSYATVFVALSIAPALTGVALLRAADAAQRELPARGACADPVTTKRRSD